MTTDKLLKLIADARDSQYLIDEGFYDPANKRLPNYRGGDLITFQLDKDNIRPFGKFIKHLAKLARVSIEAATDAACNFVIREYFEAHEDEMKKDPKGFWKRLRAKKRA
jgi:hypothetical protein